MAHAQAAVTYGQSNKNKRAKPQCKATDHRIFAVPQKHIEYSAYLRSLAAPDTDTQYRECLITHAASACLICHTYTLIGRKLLEYLKSPLGTIHIQMYAYMVWARTYVYPDLLGPLPHRLLKSETI